MVAFSRRRVNKGKLRRRIILIVFLTILLFNLDTIGRFMYPFPYRDLTVRYAETYNVDPMLLAAVMKAESNFKSRAVSVRGARGLMQIMPETGSWIAQQTGDQAFHPDRLFEPETNIQMGAWYIADLTEEFNGNTVLVLAAYNGGRGNVGEWLTSKNLSGGINTIDQIPFPETREYVKRVLWNYRVYSYLYKSLNQDKEITVKDISEVLRESLDELE